MKLRFLNASNNRISLTNVSYNFTIWKKIILHKILDVIFLFSQRRRSQVESYYRIFRIKFSYLIDFLSFIHFANSTVATVAVSYDWPRVARCQLPPPI